MRRLESTFFLTSCPQRPEKGLEAIAEVGASQSQVKYARRVSATATRTRTSTWSWSWSWSRGWTGPDWAELGWDGLGWARLFGMSAG